MIIVCFRCRQSFATPSDLFAHRMGYPSRCTLALHPVFR